METENQTELKKGTWENMQTNYSELPIIKWQKIGESHTVTMKCSEPREIPWESGVFYIFDADEEGEAKVIKTSAWSLLKELKKISQKNDGTLLGAKLKITKKMKLGKQLYEVEDLGELSLHEERMR